MSIILKILQLKLRQFNNAKPLAKGMISYGVIWPSSCTAQQLYQGGKTFKTLDWYRVLRFALYGTFYVAPTLYAWVRLSSAMWPQTSLKTSITKALVEQVSYSPFGMVSFFFLMSLLELKTPAEAACEVREKFWLTYKAGLCVWPFLQTFNFSVIPKHNRVVFVSFCSSIWTTFLSHMLSKELVNPPTKRRVCKKKHNPAKAYVSNVSKLDLAEKTKNYLNQMFSMKSL